MDWFRRAAESGYAPAMLSLGRLLAEGKAGSRDEVEAHALLSLAAQRFTEEDAADAEANRELLERLTPRLSSEQRKASQERLGVLSQQYRKPEKLKEGASST
jgi:TPR repeat protein